MLPLSLLVRMRHQNHFMNVDQSRAQGVGMNSNGIPEVNAQPIEQVTADELAMFDGGQRK